MKGPGSPRYFGSAASLRKWFDRYHATRDELWVGFRKVGCAKRSVRYGEAVDAGLCFGWIDGVRYRIDDENYTIRFTPRRRGSIWSAVNLKKMAVLQAAGLVRPSGLTVFMARDPAKTNRYSFERAAATLAPEESRAFRANRPAWTFWQAQAPSYRRAALHWVTSAKRPPTRVRRLAALIADSTKGWRLKSLRRQGDPGFGA